MAKDKVLVKDATNPDRVVPVYSIRGVKEYFEVFGSNMAMIDDLIVDALRTDSPLSGKEVLHYIWIQDQHLKFMEANRLDEEPKIPFQDIKGRFLFWKDATKEEMTYDETDYPVMVYQYDQDVKMQIAFETDPETGYNIPIFQIGEGDGVTPLSGKSFIHKTPDGLKISYYSNNSAELRSIRFSDDGIEINPPIIKVYDTVNFYEDVGSTTPVELEGVSIAFNIRTTVKFMVQIDATASEALTATAKIRVDGTVHKTTVKKFDGAYKDQIVFTGVLNKVTPATRLIDVTLETDTGTITVDPEDYKLTLTVLSGLDRNSMYQFFRISGTDEAVFAAKTDELTGDLSQIYAVTVTDGLATVKSKPAPYVEDFPWTNKFNIDYNIDKVGICFDGYWKRNEETNSYIFISDEKPFIFYTQTGSLKVQLYDETPVELASSVVKFKTIKGWQSTRIPTNDHGVMVVYTKVDGHVYYRNYCMQSDGNKSWEGEREITELPTDTVDIALFRTNDYRIGIIAQDSSGNVSYIITERNWAGMAIPAEYISAAPVVEGGLTVDLIPIEYIDGFMPDETISVVPTELNNVLGYTLTDNKFAEIYNEPMTLTDEFDEEYEDWGKVIVFRTKHRLFNLHAGDFEVVGEYTSYFADEIEEVVEEVGFDGKLYRIKFLGTNNFNNAGENPSLKYNSGITTNGIDIPYVDFEKGFSPQNLVPEFIPLPEVQSVWNE